MQNERVFKSSPRLISRKRTFMSMPRSLQKRKSCTVNIVRLRKICRRFKEQNMISTSSLKVMKSRRRNVSENTISLDNSIWGICRFKTYGFSSFFISEENSNGIKQRFVRITQPSVQLVQGDWGCATNERIVAFCTKKHCSPLCEDAP